jgi:DNA modification methylase
MTPKPLQLRLPYPPLSSKLLGTKGKTDRIINDTNKLDPQDRAFHDWYRFILSFPPHLVRKYIQEFALDNRHTILDPFCGTGTTLVEAKMNGIAAIGLEANPFPHFAGSIKTDWSIDVDSFKSRAYDIAKKARELLLSEGINDDQPYERDISALSLKTLDPNAARLLIKDSISPLPLHKVLVLLDFLDEHKREPYYRHALLSLGNALLFSISNLRFGPEVGIGKLKNDIPVIASWLHEVNKMAVDLSVVAGKPYPLTRVHLADARQIGDVIEPDSIDAVITSPPYPNEKDYTRTTRLESVVLGFIGNITELRKLKKKLIRSNTRGVYATDDDDQWIADHAEIQRVAQAIEKRRLELGKTSGFEKLYEKVTRLYFGGMARHLAELRPLLRSGAQLAYVVGDQGSYLRVMIRTGQLLADIAQRLGYDLVRIDLFRTRFATATKEELREEVVVLRWPGQKE